MPRGSATPGELAAAEWGARRLREAGAADVRVEPFAYQRSWAARHGAYMAAGLLAAAVGGGTDAANGSREGAGSGRGALRRVRGVGTTSTLRHWAAAALALGSLSGFEDDLSGRRQALARVAPTGVGANAIGRVAARGRSRRTLVLVAHHDTAQTGLAWRHPWLAGVGLRAALARLRGAPAPDSMESFSAGPETGFALVALGALLRRPRLRALGGLLLAAPLALALDVAHGPAVPGASDNATGVAAVLALVEAIGARPFDDVEVIAVLTGCEESGMGGMAAWLRSEGAELDPATTLVLGLDTLGAGEPVVLRAEGPLRAAHYRPRDLDWADRGARRAGVVSPRRFRIGGWTDPILAVHSGLPTISLLSVNGAAFTDYHLPTDTPERVDWGSVGRCLALARGIAEAWAERQQ